MDVYGDATGFFLRSAVDFLIFEGFGKSLLGKYMGNGASQGRFSVVNVTNGPDI